MRVDPREWGSCLRKTPRGSPFHHVRAQQEGLAKAQEGGLERHLRLLLDLGLPALGTVKNKYLFFTSYPVSGILP